MEADMSVDTAVEIDRSAPYVDRRLASGSVALMTGGVLLWMLGAAVGAVAAVGASRRYVASLEESPRVTASRRWRQVRSATTAGVRAGVGAGVGAWQDSGKH
jgi:hypothetical protein